MALAVLLVAGAGLALWAGGGGLSLDDLALDSGAAITDGKVEGIEPVPGGEKGGLDRIAFSYAVGPDGRARRGSCYAQGLDLAVGQPRTVQYLPAAPEVARLRGTTLAPPGRRRTLPVVLAAAGLVALGVWLRLLTSRRSRADAAGAVG